MLHHVDGIAFGADIAVDYFSLLFEVGNDLFAVTNTVLDQFELILGQLFVFVGFGQQGIGGFDLRFGFADLFT